MIPIDMKDTPAVLPECRITLVTDIQLEQEQVVEWMECLEEMLPPEIIKEVDDPDNENQVLLEMAEWHDWEEDAWKYSVALTRHVTMEEGHEVAETWGERYADDYDVTATTEPVSPADFKFYESVEVDPGYEQAYMEQADEIRHNRWMQEQISAGWRFGMDETAGDKLCNCLLPWDRLSREQQERARGLWGS